MPNIFSLIGESYDFLKKQPVLNTVLLWLYMLPMIAMHALGSLQEQHSAFLHIPLVLKERNGMLIVLVVFAELALSIILLWGTSCTLIVARKLLGNGAGRSRSSFRTVRTEAAGYVANIFITGILRSIFTLFWGLLLVIPGIIYTLRTFFFQISIVCEGKEYRDALQHSKSIVIGHTWTALIYILGLVLVLFFPLIFFTSFSASIVENFDSRLLIPFHVIAGSLWGFVSLLFTLCTVLLYSHIKKLPKKPVIQSVQP
jgi:uncharacterized membrane protein